MTTTPLFARPFLFALFGCALALAPRAAQAQQEPSAEQLLESVDDLYRGRSSEGTMRLHVKTDRWERTLTLRSFSEGEEKTLLRIEQPEKEQGLSTLMVGGDIWNYLPKVDRTMKVPASMMSDSWMGSHLSNDDLVHESRFSDDYECDFKRRARSPKEIHVISCKPKPDAPVVWGEVVLRLRASDNIPVDEKFYDERGTLVRTIEFSDVRSFDGRRIPSRMTVIPADKPGERTELVIEDLRFDVELPQDVFTIERLKAPRLGSDGTSGRATSGRGKRG